MTTAQALRDQGMAATENATDLFWSRVDRTGGPDSCWAWTGAVQSKGGRGRVIINGRQVYAYRRAWELTHGTPIPSDMLACHACDNPNCVNPAHIFLGTQRDNMSDAARKGRARNNPTSGVDHHAVNTSDALVFEARELYAAGHSTPVIAERLKVPRGTIQDWVAGKTRLAAGGPIVRQGVAS